MADVISIVNTRNNELEFDVNVRGGGDGGLPTVRFVIEDKNINYCFMCKNLEDDKWSVEIPPIPQLTKKAYPFRLEVIVDGYYFEPYRKTLNIISEPKVNSSEPEKTRPKEPEVKISSSSKPAAKIPKKKVTKKKVTKEDISDIIPDTIHMKEETPEIIKDDIQPEMEEDSFANMADRWLNRDKPVLSEKDKKVKEALDGVIKKPSINLAPEPEKPEVTINEKDVKIRAILDSTKH